MLELSDMWMWASALKSSPAFWIALPIATAALLATIANRVEAYLAQEQSEQGDRGAHVGRRASNVESETCRVPARVSTTLRDLA